MEELVFKTTINCGSCVSKVTGFLDEFAGQGHWHVETTHPDKLLHLSNTNLDEDDLILGLARLGYIAETAINQK